MVLCGRICYFSDKLANMGGIHIIIYLVSQTSVFRGYIIDYQYRNKMCSSLIRELTIEKIFFNGGIYLNYFEESQYRNTC